MSRTYRYVGPSDIKERVSSQPSGTEICTPADVLSWARSSGQRVAEGQLLPATYVVVPDARLLIADRHSEHVACAGGADVLAAGEIFFAFSEGHVSVEQVTNQSTGYCPEPESWPAVQHSLDRAGLPYPGGFTTECVFRRCPACGERNVVKDAWFCCGVCGSELPEEWNFQGG